MNKLFLLTTLLLLSSQSFGESVSKKTDKYALVSANSALETLLEIPDVKMKYDECQKDEERKKDMAKCVWEKVSLDSDLKKQVLEKYNKLSIKEDKNAKRAPASEEKADEKTKDALAAKKLNLATNYADDPQVQALTAFYKKKLDEVLTPTAKTEGEKGQINSVDHSKFINLYESELGKTIINAFTSYCLETNPTCGEKEVDAEGNISYGSCNVPEEVDKQKKNRETNLASLKESGGSFDSNSAESTKWTYCITQVSEICAKGGHAYSRNRSCLIVDYVKSARESLIAVNGQKEFWNTKLTHNPYSVSANFKDPTANNPDASADKLTSITAKDIHDSSKKVTEQTSALMDQCLIKQADGSHKLGDEEACKAFMNTNKEESEMALTEFQLRQEAQTELLKEKLDTGDQKAIEVYLAQEGYTKEQITTLLTSNNPANTISDMIKDRFENEKAALIEEMKNRVSKKTSKEEGKITEADISNLEHIKNELLSRETDLAQSVQFNNIVSSYLSYSSTENGKETVGGRNVASLFAEVESIQDKEVSKTLQDKIDKANLKKSETSAVLGLDNLNGILLRYFDGQTGKKEDKKK